MQFTNLEANLDGESGLSRARVPAEERLMSSIGLPALRSGLHYSVDRMLSDGRSVGFKWGA